MSLGILKVGTAGICSTLVNSRAGEKHTAECFEGVDRPNGIIRPGSSNESGSGTSE